MNLLSLFTLLLFINLIYGLLSNQIEPIISFYNEIRLGAYKTGPKPLGQLNPIVWSNVIQSNLGTFVNNCSLDSLPDKSIGISYLVWKVYGSGSSLDEIDPVSILNATFQESSKLYDWSTYSCKSNSSCEAYIDMMSNSSTSFACETSSSLCENSWSILLCAHYPFGSFAGVPPYTPSNQLVSSKRNSKSSNSGGNGNKKGMVQSIQFNDNNIDWRKLGYVTPVKNQQGCGSCWAFTICAMLEANYLIKNNLPNTDIDLSEQNFVSCVNYGCQGGNGQLALDTLDSIGTMYESDYPYQSIDEKCPFQKSIFGTFKQTSSQPTFKWLGYNNIESSTESFIQYLKIGPIYASMYVDQGLQQYHSGVYSCSTVSTPNHAITVVGYSVADDSFIIKNSWGLLFGQNGYFYLKSGSCNLYYFAAISPKL